MEVSQLSALFSIYVCLMRFERTHGISYKNMDDYCGSRISMDGDNQLSLYFSDDDECEVTIATTSQFPNMMLYFERFSVGCIYGTVTIRNKYGEPSSGLPESLCGYVSSSKVYTHNGDVKIKYVSKNGWTYASFSLIATLYSDSSTCGRWDHVCANGRCIDQDLKCNGYNSCGDNSGCSDDNNESSVSGVSIGVGISVGVIVLVIATVTIICCRRRSIGIPTQQPQPTAPGMQVVYAVHANSGQLNQRFSHGLYGIHMQQTAANNLPTTPLYDHLPPPYDPTWAPKDMKPDCQNELVSDQNVLTRIEKATGSDKPNMHEEGYIYDNVAADCSDDHYSTLDDIGANVNQHREYAPQ
ncbi:uncharacterized protein LOC127844246 isoform X1 [Dreissena polymorpha]|uniref:CUB domain-containing protein n=1 Tax=Dreissena polymorpha TaxID=45954 RepID=A0A9D4E1U2_DREPO|nr:uncharacterized protein LOC127844246 isoform X1 [Dreissena polymorpha]KAH3771223.1 hypothetical protein DPMN_172532 [Dreissena polymorpha]